MCQHTLGNGLHQQLNCTGKVGEGGHEECHVLHAVVADGIDFKACHVFGYDLREVEDTVGEHPRGRTGRENMASESASGKQTGHLA